MTDLEKFDNEKKLTELLEKFHDSLTEIIGSNDVVIVVHEDHAKGKCQGYMCMGTVPPKAMTNYLGHALQNLMAEQALRKIIAEAEADNDAEPTGDAPRPMDPVLKH